MRDETGAVAVTTEDLRPLMLSIAYRMVGSFSEAEDLVQEAFVRLHEAGDEVVVTYEAERADGSRFRNTEIFSFEAGKVKSVEVYFGWNL